MTRLRIMFAAVIFGSALGAVAVASPASAADCYQTDSTIIDSGVSRAELYLDYCGDFYLLVGTLWDTSCDNRTAYLDIWPNIGGGSTASASGCGARRDIVKSYSTSLSYIDVRTRACNVTCSSSASDRLYG